VVCRHFKALALRRAHDEAFVWRDEDAEPTIGVVGD
jgi:hypothetical protein